jgi:hypothetical protein
MERGNIMGYDINPEDIKGIEVMSKEDEELEAAEAILSPECNKLGLLVQPQSL